MSNTRKLDVIRFAIVASVFAVSLALKPGSDAAAQTFPKIITTDIDTGAPGTPPPKPLPTRQKVVVGVPGPNEKMAPLFLAQHFGEFTKENLDVEIVFNTAPNLFPLMATGRVDVLFSSPSGYIFNAIYEKIPVKWIAGTSDSTDCAGFYVSTKYGSDAKSFDPSKLKGTVIGVAPGEWSSAATFANYETLKLGGVNIKETKVRVVSTGPETIAAITQGAISGANVGSPWGCQMENDKIAFQARGYTITIASYFSTPLFIEQRRPVAVAFWRAMLRAERTYLATNYHDRPDVLNALASALKADPEAMKPLPVLTFTLALRPDAVKQLWNMYRDVGGILAGDREISVDELIDQSVINEAAAR